MTAKLKACLPPQAQARAQDWFDTCVTVSTKKGRETRDHSANNFGYKIWNYEDDVVKIEYWSPYELLQVSAKDLPERSLILMIVHNGKLSVWAPEEDILNHLKSLVVLDLLAESGQ